MDNGSNDNGDFGFADLTTGTSGDFGTQNSYSNNTCSGNTKADSTPFGLCDQARP